MTGIYTFKGLTDKGNTSDKFWQLRKLKDGSYEARWGKVHERFSGRQGKIQGKKVYTFNEACKKADEKVRKGYELNLKVG